MKRQILDEVGRFLLHKLLYIKRLRMGEIISQIVGFIKDSDQNGDWVSENYETCHICVK